MAQAFLSSIRVEDVAQPAENMIIVDSQASIGQTLNVLIKNNILCAPVQEKSSGQFIGLVDMLDLVTFLVEYVKNRESLNNDFLSFIAEDTFQPRTASDLSDLSKRNKMCPVPQGASLLEAMTVMATNHVQRVPVMIMGPKGEFTGVISLLTQSAVIAFLAKHTSELGGLAKTLHEVGFGPKEVFSIVEDKPALDAFKMMASHHISGLPVVDTDNQLLANISARDLRVIANDPKMFQYLAIEAGDFVTHIRTSNPSPKDMHPSISCTLEEPFHRVVSKLAAAHIHRIYITDSQRKLVSVVSLHDIIQKVISGGL
eukprot:TRINITY_DN1354_c0_g1_i1.p1 TRINITY_DN1354_c0_g1~~TRINITY_DN1354_c0_g1_i1.p1  ORF type:complete len:314 (-),score=98.25 TRINITY_DN1354_c0_g1_i1:755-1696(-)